MRGFTLIETIVALAVSGIVFLGSAALVTAVSDAVLEVRRLGTDVQARTNGERTLARLARSLVPTSGADPPLVGDELRAEFRSRCIRPGGWTSTCSVTLALTDDPTRLLEVRREPGGRTPVPLQESPLKLRYLVRADAGGLWASKWSSIVPPLAVGVILPTDTLVFPLGPSP